MRNIYLILLSILFTTLSYSQDPTVYITNGGSGYSVIEGNSYDFTVSMYSAATTDVIIDVTTIANSADVSDYTPMMTTITIPAGQLSSSPLSIPTTNDSTIELNENFTIEAVITSNNTGNTNVSRSIIIWDNDTTPTVNFNSVANIVEGDSYFTSVSLSNYFTSDVTINFSTSPGSANTSDYNDTSTTVTIPVGQLSASIAISTQEDALIESDEDYTLTGNVTTGNTTNASINITVNIIDNDTPPTVLPLDEQSVREQNDRYIYVRLDREYVEDVDILLTTSNGTADNADYTPISQTITISAGNRSANYLLDIIDDTLDEPQETINVTATVTSGNTANSSVNGIVTIVDNDGLPDIAINGYYDDNDPSNASYGLSAEEGYPIRFRVGLTHSSPVDTDFTITTSDGTADASDYTTSTFNVTIPAGQTYGSYDTLNYPTILDQIDEVDENFFITATATTGNTFNTSETVEATIINNYHLNAQNDEINSILEVGTTFQVLDNDTFEGLSVNASNLNISLLGIYTYGITLDASGLLDVPSNTPIGYYSLQYEICETANPTNCDIAFLNIRVLSPLEATHIATYVDSNGDGYTSVGDTIEFEFTITNNGNAVITDIDAEVPYQDIEIVGGSLATLAPGETDNTTFTALHILTQEDINFGFYGGDLEGAYFYGTYYGYEVIDYLYNPSQSFQIQQSDGIEFNAFIDTNGNGTQESGEINFPLGVFEYEVNNDGNSNFLYVSPHYLYESNPNTTYDLNHQVDSDYASVITSSASYSNVTIPIGSGITPYDFPVTVTPYDDLAVELTEYWRPPIPGFHSYNNISFTNNSNQVVSAGSIEFTMDSALNLEDVTEISQYWTLNPVTVTPTATGFVYTFNNLQPFETRRLRVRMSVPTLPTVSLGQLVNNSVSIELLPGDIVASNNSSNLTQTIVGSYDPNDITERHGPEVVHSEFTSEDYLTYTIRFENTGTANAINIRIEDLLDEQLDESTLKMVSASHTYSLERVGKQLEWNFYGINLPPSEEDDTQIGHGYLTFKIKPFSGYAVGDIIPNTAEIYFDFNPPIITNTWTTEFVEDNLSVDDNSFDQLSVFPNPSNGTIWISNATILNNVEITSILGRRVLSQKIDASESSIDITSLANGVYLMTLTSNENQQTVKIVKE